MKLKSDSDTFNYFCLSYFSGKLARIFLTDWLNGFKVIFEIIWGHCWFFQPKIFLKNLQIPILKEIVDLLCPALSKTFSISLNFLRNPLCLQIYPMSLSCWIFMIFSWQLIRSVASIGSLMLVVLISVSLASSSSLRVLSNFCFTFSCVFFLTMVFPSMWAYKK